MVFLLDRECVVRRLLGRDVRPFTRKGFVGHRLHGFTLDAWNRIVLPLTRVPASRLGFVRGRVGADGLPADFP